MFILRFGQQLCSCTLWLLLVVALVSSEGSSVRLGAFALAGCERSRDI